MPRAHPLLCPVHSRLRKEYPAVFRADRGALVSNRFLFVKYIYRYINIDILYI